MKKTIRGLELHRGQYRFSLMRNGVRTRYYLGTSDLAQAIALAADIKRHGAVVDADILSVELERAIREKLAGAAIRDKTARVMRNAATQFISFAGDISVSRVNGQHVGAWLLELRTRNAEAGVQSYVRIMRSLFNHLVSKKRRLDNPFQVKLPRMSKSPRRDFCSRALRDRLIESAPDDDLRFALYCGFHAGLRRNEISEARPEWFDLDSRVIHVVRTDTFTPKDGEDRSLPMSAAFRDFLVSYGLRGPYTLKPEVGQGRAEYRYDFRRPFALHMVANNCSWVTPHTMRRTFASLLVSAGVSIYKVAKWLGDGVTVVEKAYGHLIASDSDIEKL